MKHKNAEEGTIFPLRVFMIVFRNKRESQCFISVCSTIASTIDFEFIRPAKKVVDTDVIKIRQFDQRVGCGHPLAIFKIG